MQNVPSPTIISSLPGFLDYMAAERRFSPKTITTYREAVRYFTHQVGDLPLGGIALNHFISFKARMVERRVGESRIAVIVNAMKCLLVYARDVLQLPILDLGTIRAPRAPRRQVSYLTADELEAFLTAIPLHTWTGKARLSGFGFRALVETLAATGMRISEALSLDRDSIDRERKEAVIIGKGNKQRTVFFTDRALMWITRYMDLRRDSNPALFVTLKGTRLNIDAVEPMFRRHVRWAGLEKHVTPHVIRHTTATMLLRNGCPMGFIKEILGHTNLETTCRYYLGIMSQADTKNAHQTYLGFDSFRKNS